MKYSQPEVKIINESIKFVNRWRWYKYVLVVTVIVLIWFSYFLITNEGYGKFSALVGVPVGLLLGYLKRNWTTPRKEALLIKLVSNLKTPN
ncbi:hypothetical protein QWY77_11760 [Thalassotalea ponticola]|uniref:hypothetical protein n=1 Tax=Thalassotalea ponticola TaxID=1523392 RepID=UPI0025B53D37|nr:hypothetical protein [Thalassotalea ponticola]MDN3653418.1 hypothetical protein [Thalassotalea ponticola]